MLKNIVLSVIIRTYNESKYLDEILSAIFLQDLDSNFDIEVVIVDSGSTDGTIKIAKSHNVRITTINKQDFTFGRSLNIGCEFSKGSYLIFISGHCVPTNSSWLKNLVQPIMNGECDYTYGRQVGRDTTKYSEQQVFSKYFPLECSVPNKGFFCNNANAALLKSTWEKYKFDEFLTGLEDMHLAKKIVDNGHFIGYVSTAVVYHIHDETWGQIKNRYEREAIALQKIMPEVHVSVRDMISFIIIGIWTDLSRAIKSKVFFQEFIGILKFRFLQFYGSYRGNHISKKVSYNAKMKYYYPEIK
jgi:rhamnosyltransferase